MHPDKELRERDRLSNCAHAVAADFLPTAMRNPTVFQISILRCVLLNTLTFGITDDDLIEKVFSCPGYRKDAERVRDAVSSQIGALIARTQDLIEASA